MDLFGQKLLHSDRVVVFGQKWLCSGKSGCIRQKCFNSEKVVVFVQKRLYSGKVVVFG